jgi:hypothetical protein
MMEVANPIGLEGGDAPGHFAAAVRRPIVNEEQLPVGERLRLNTAYRLFQKWQAVQEDRDD